uniref:Calicivirus coat protein domain-containing protein n=1 Tax=Picornavirales sp. TaxID=1955153 RepID=A0A6M9Z834_9VIRU|nr:MAG: hypothetical protein 2 [Picornavirales sp.]
MSHIPQPTSGDDIQTEFHSTQLQPKGPTIAPIETPTPNTREVQAAAGEEVTIPDYFYKQWRRVATLEWTTNDPIGKLLWSANVSPLELDPALAYQMALFHAWGGDFEISVRAVATGFHAGQMAIVSVPPGINLTDINNPLDYSLYPYDVMDVKKLEANSFTIRDRRNTKYHYLKRDGSAPSINDIGGSVGVFVDTPLSTSATGVQKISLAVWARCASNFRVAYVRNPLTHQPKQLAYVPETLIDALNASKYSQLANGPNDCYYIEIQPSSLKIISQYMSNCCKMNGVIYDTQTKVSQKNRWRELGAFRVDVASDGAAFIPSESTKYWPESFGQTWVLTDFSQSEAVKLTSFSRSFGYMLEKPSNFKSKTVTAFVPTGDHPFNLGSSEPITIVKEGEGIVCFTANFKNQKCIQSDIIAQILWGDILRGRLPRNKCYLITLKSKLTDLPLTYLKFHTGGYMTAPSSKSATSLFDFSDIYFEQSGLIGVLDSFPNPISLASNVATHLFLAKQRKKNSVTGAKVSTKWQPLLEHSVASLEAVDSQASSLTKEED